MRKKRRFFTLLEVIIALLILAIGIFAFLSQLALASSRVSDSGNEWAQVHELVNATEYILLTGNEPDPQFLEPEKYTVKYSIVRAELPGQMKHPAVGMTLKTVTVRLLDKQSGDELQTLRADCFRQAAEADVKEK